RAVLTSAAVLGAGLAVMGLAPTVSALAAVSVGAGVANGVLNVTSSALIYGRASADERGRVGAVVGGAASGAQLAAYSAGGGLARDQGGVHVVEDGLARDDDPGDVLAGRHLVHHRQQDFFHDRPQAARPGAAHDGLIGDGLEGVVAELELDVVQLEQLGVLA